MAVGFTCNYNNDIDGVARNDIYLDETGNIAIAKGNDLTVANVYHAIELNLSEYSFNTLLGIDWRNYLNSNKPQGNRIKIAVIKAILSVNGVNRIANFNMDILRETRQLIIDVTIILNDGTSVPILRTI